MFFGRDNATNGHKFGLTWSVQVLIKNTGPESRVERIRQISLPKRRSEKGSSFFFDIQKVRQRIRQSVR